MLSHVRLRKHQNSCIIGCITAEAVSFFHKHMSIKPGPGLICIPAVTLPVVTMLHTPCSVTALHVISSARQLPALSCVYIIGFQHLILSSSLITQHSHSKLPCMVIQSCHAKSMQASCMKYRLSQSWLHVCSQRQRCVQGCLKVCKLFIGHVSKHADLYACAGTLLRPQPVFC